VIPFDAGPHAAMDLPFTLLTNRPPLTGRLAYCEQMTSAVYVDDDEQVARYSLAFDHLRAVALSPDRSKRLIEKVTRELA
jgi:Domain of unknown function (DUF5753)